MLQRSDIKRILTDLYRTELSSSHPEASVNCQETAESLWIRMPLDIKQRVDAKAARLFGYAPRSFSFFERMVDYCYASFLKNGQLALPISHTSGKTEESRVLTTEMMWKESREIAALFPEVKRIISMVSSTSWYGFTFATELPHILQVPLISLPDQPAQEWNITLQAGDLVVATPLFWNYWLRCGNQFPNGVEVVTATAPCNEELAAQLTAMGAGAVTDIYGSSETGPLGFRRKVTDPFAMFSFWSVSLSQGTVRLKHACRSEWITLSAQIRPDEDRRFYPLGQAVSVPVTHTTPVRTPSPIERVEQVLSSHPAVRACRVRTSPSLSDNHLEAFVSLREGYTPNHVGIIRTFLRQHLPAPEIPESFTFEQTAAVVPAHE